MKKYLDFSQEFGKVDEEPVRAQYAFYEYLKRKNK